MKNEANRNKEKECPKDKIEDVETNYLQGA
jgi:hypothetical protein